MNSPSDFPPRGFHGQRSSLGDVRASLVSSPPSNGPLPIPGVNGGSAGGHMRGGSAGMPVPPPHLSRSPPSQKNTSHVPCKFFRQGNCQAGSACPFLHTIDADAPCKYFQLGKCKYGQKCALAHILPNGRRANPPMQNRPGARHLVAGQPDPFALSEPMISPNSAIPTAQGYNGQYRIPQDTLSLRRITHEQASYHDAFGTSPRNSDYGSPPISKSRLALSPKVTAQDVGLPSSFDPDTLSNYARHNGPISSSIPSGGLGWNPFSSTSPTTSTNRQQAFGNLDSALLSTGAENSAVDPLGASPPMSQVGSSPPAAAMTQPKKLLHSERRAIPQSIVSASLPVPSHMKVFTLEGDDDADYGFEEERVPEALNELLTPQERQRRYSRNQDDAGRPTLPGFGSPTDSKVGSPSNASPSRWGPLFERQRRDASDNNVKPSSPSSRGYFGSPLGRSPRISAQSGGGFSSSPSFGVIGPPSKSGDVSPHVSSPPRTGGMGLLSQQLKRTHLNAGSTVEKVDGSETLRPGNASRNIGSILSGAGRFERAVSSSNITHERIDEEPLFSMDDEDEATARDRETEQGMMAGERGKPSYAGAAASANGAGL